MGVNTVIFVSLLLDLLAFTLILPLLPSTLECFSVSDESGFYKFIQSFIDSSQSLIGSPEKFNKALFGGLLGSWYSLLQFITMPMIGSLSDVYGRKVLYLVCLVGISLSYLLWNLSAGYFSVFVLFRTLGGLSKGNISLSGRMRFFIAVALIAFIGLAQAFAFAFVPCADPAGHVGHWIGRDQECAALVQTSCHRQPGNRQIGLTSSWRRGLHVKENCNKIPRLTAIATFLGPNGMYDEPHLHQHTAIFVQCEAAGIRVYDQWNGTPIAYRVIPWAGHNAQYSGNNFWTIAG